MWDPGSPVTPQRRTGTRAPPGTPNTRYIAQEFIRDNIAALQPQETLIGLGAEIASRVLTDTGSWALGKAYKYAKESATGFYEATRDIPAPWYKKLAYMNKGFVKRHKIFKLRQTPFRAEHIRGGRYIKPEPHKEMRRYGKRRRSFGRRRMSFRRRRSFRPKRRAYGRRRRTFNKRRVFRRYSRRGSKLAWKVQKGLNGYQTFRRISADYMTWASGARAEKVYRLYNHTYSNSTVTGNTNTYSDFGNGVLAAMRATTWAAGANTNIGASVHYPYFDKFSTTVPQAPKVKVYVAKAKKVIQIRNNTLMPVHLKVKYWKARINLPSNANPTTDLTCAYSPYEATKYQMSTEYTKNTTLAAANFDLTFVNYMTDSTWAKVLSKLTRTHNVMLQAGESTMIVLRMKPRIFDLWILQQMHQLMSAGATATGYGAWAFKGEPYVTIEARGELGHDTAFPTTRIDYLGPSGATATKQQLDIVIKEEFKTAFTPGSGNELFSYVNAMTAPSGANAAIIQQPGADAEIE